MHQLIRSYLEYYHVFFYISSLSKAATLPSLISTNANLNLIAPTATNLSDFSSFPDLPNEQYDYSAEYRGPRLSETACMMVSVYAMRELALLPDFDQIVPEKTWIMPGYPQVALWVGNPGDITEARWVTWTITAAIRDMMTRNIYQTSRWVGIYLDIRVAVVKFLVPERIETLDEANRTEYAAPQIPGAASTANDSSATVSINVGDLTLNTSSNDDQLWANITYKNKEISRKDMFMAIIWALLNMAPHKDDELVRILTITGTAITATVTTSFSRSRAIPPQIEPLRYGNVISLMAKLPEVLLRENMFREMDILVKDNNVVIGKGTVRSPALNKFLKVPLTANVSLS